MSTPSFEHAVATLYSFLTSPSREYSSLPHSINQCLVFGCNDLAVAEFATHIINKSHINHAVISGGLGRLSQHSFTESEARTFFKHLTTLDCDTSKIFLEERATNTAENIQFSLPMLRHPKQATVLICKPIMAQRVGATWQKLCDWDYVIRTPLATTIQQQSNVEHLAHMMVGEIERLMYYPQQGFISAVTTPTDVDSAYKYLKNTGYTQHCLTRK